MSKHFHLTAVTQIGVASNNRGDNDGSTQANLHQVTFDKKIISLVSGTSIRWAIREYLQNHYPDKMNRTYCPEANENTFKDEEFSRDYIDDDSMGYMNAKTDKKRRGIFEVTCAEANENTFKDEKFSRDFINDDSMGYMDAKAGNTQRVAWCGSTTAFLAITRRLFYMPSVSLKKTYLHMGYKSQNTDDVINNEEQENV